MTTIILLFAAILIATCIWAHPYVYPRNKEIR